MLHKDAQGYQDTEGRDKVVVIFDDMSLSLYTPCSFYGKSFFPGNAR